MTKITGLDGRILQIEENQRLLIAGFGKLDGIEKRLAVLEENVEAVESMNFSFAASVASLREHLDVLHGDVDAMTSTDG